MLRVCLKIIALITICAQISCAKIGARGPAMDEQMGPNELKAWAALQSAKQDLLLTFQTINAGSKDGLCNAAHISGADPVIVDRINSMSSLQVNEAKQFILSNAAQIEQYLGQDLHDVAYLSAKPFFLAGLQRSALTNPQGHPPTGYVTEDITLLSQDVVDALMAHEVGHMMVDPIANHLLNDVETVGHFKNGMTKLDDVGACLVGRAHYLVQMKQFIYSLYGDVFGRLPTEIELSAAHAVLASTDSAQLSRQTLATQLLSLPEATTQMVVDVYQQFYNRAPAGDELLHTPANSSVYDIVTINRELYLLVAMVFSQEYYTDHGSPDPQTWEGVLGPVLIGRALTPGEKAIIDNWEAASAAQNNQEAPYQYGYGPFDIYFLPNVRAARLQYYYQKYLGRAASDQEITNLNFQCEISGANSLVTPACYGYVLEKAILLSTDEYFDKAAKKTFPNN